MKSELTFKKNCLTPIAAAICLLSPIPAAWSQAVPAPVGATSTGEANTESATLGTVQITARRRLETQFDVPAAVTAISGASLRESGVTNISDIIDSVPNAVVTESPNGVDTYISIRGMRQADVKAEPNFGMYRNGVFAGGHRVNLGAQVDVSRMEILRGPQGGLYGRNAVGGAVNVIYNMPTPGQARNGYATVSLESDKRTRLEGAITSPINENVATRATVWHVNQTGGEYFNSFLNEQIDRNSDKGLRFSLAANLSSAWSALGTLEYQKTSGPSLRVYAPNGVPNGGFAPFFPAVVSPAETPETVQHDTPSVNDTEQFYAAGKFSYSAPAGGTLTLMASYRDYTLKDIQDQDYTALALDSGPLVLKQVLRRNEAIKQFYTEALWESDPALPTTWRTGLSYFKETFNLAQNFGTTLDTGMLGFIPGIPDLGVVGGFAGIPNDGSSIAVDSISVFGDIRHEFSKQMAMTATLRYTQDKAKLNWSQGIDLAASNPVAAALFSTSVPTFKLDNNKTFSFLSPSVGLEYKASPDANLYAIYSTGYRPGGFNTTVTNAAYIPYDQESAQSVEAGIKSRWLGGRLGVNASVFSMTQTDLAISQDDPVDTQFNFNYLANVGKARTNGFELETIGRFNNKLGGSLSLGYLDAKYTEGVINAGTAAALDVTGRNLQGVRPWTINAKMDYRTPVSGDTEFFGSIGVRREIGGVIGNNSDVPLESITKINLNAGLSFAKKTQLSAFVHNATDQKVVTFRFINGAVATNPGRRIGLQLTHQF